MSRRRIFVFTFTENILPDPLPLINTNFVPKLIVHDAIHGISCIELINFRETAVLIPFLKFQIRINGKPFQIELLNNTKDTHSIETVRANSNVFECPCINLEMDGVVFEDEIRLINLSTTNRNAKFYIRFPLFLNTYCVNISVRCQLITSGGLWSEWTQKHAINIPLSLITKRFAQNEMVLFSPTHSNHSIPGKIITQLDGYSELYQVQTVGIGQKKCWDVSASRIYRNGPHLKHIVIDIDRTKRNEIYKQILFGTHRIDGYDDVYSILIGIYHVYAEVYCKGFKSISDTDYAFIGRYVAINVLPFVFDIKDNVQYDVLKCIMNDKDGNMRLRSVWQSSIVNHMELLKFHEDNDLIIINPMKGNAKFSCDLCGVEISVYEWMFECNGDHNVLNKHFVCLICGYNIAHQYTQMLKILTHCLSEYCYVDCIQLIASFVCGCVVGYKR